MLLMPLNIKNIVARKIDGVKDAIKEKKIKNSEVNKYELFSFNLIFLNKNNNKFENIETCKPDNANKCVMPFIL